MVLVINKLGNKCIDITLVVHRLLKLFQDRSDINQNNKRVEM